jgi:class 3 adenylate cyclase
MADVPETRYARSGDVHIAYQVVGGGSRDLVYLPEWSSPLEGRWVDPAASRPLERLASFSRLISFDKRGIGCSDPVPLRELTVVEEWMDDISTVMNAVSSERAALFAATESGPAAVLFAATYPERTTALVLVNTLPKWLSDDDYPWGMPRAAHVRLLQDVDDDWETGRSLALVAPTVAGNDHLRRWWARGRRLQASPGTPRALFSAWAGIDVRPVLSLVRCPTLVLHRVGASVVRVGHGRYLAQHIPDAKYLELPGADTLWWTEGGDAVVDEVEHFLTGVRHGPESDRVLATVLFTDIVDSTARTAEMGDRRWRAVLDEYDATVIRELERFRGRHVKLTGDGTLATFDGPARAIRCACALRDAVRELGLEIRLGLHTGEIEFRGDDVTGIAVNIASRVMASAGPGVVLVSRTVVDLVAGSGLEFEDRGEHELKGVPGIWKLFAVRS